MWVVLVAARGAALAPLARDPLGGCPAARAVAARAFPVEELHRHAAEREELVRQPRPLHRHERLAVEAVGQRGVARQARHPARRAAVGPEPERLLRHAVESLRELARREAEPAALGDDDELLLLHQEPVTARIRRRTAVLGGHELAAQAIAVER